MRRVSPRTDNANCNPPILEERRPGKSPPPVNYPFARWRVDRQTRVPCMDSLAAAHWKPKSIEEFCGAGFGKHHRSKNGPPGLLAAGSDAVRADVLQLCRPRECRLCRVADESGPRVFRVGLWLRRDDFLRRLRAAADPQQYDGAQAGRPGVVLRDPARLGRRFDRDSLCPRRDEFLRASFRTGFGGSRVSSRGRALRHLLVPRKNIAPARSRATSSRPPARPSSADRSPAPSSPIWIAFSACMAGNGCS